MRVIFVVMKATFRVEPMTSHLLIRSSHTWFHSFSRHLLITRWVSYEPKYDQLPVGL